MQVKDYILCVPHTNTQSAGCRGGYTAADKTDNFFESINRAKNKKTAEKEESAGTVRNSDAEENKDKTSEEEWNDMLRRTDEELEQIRQENRREQERVQKERIRKNRIRKKMEQKLILKKYLARQDEIDQMNEKISLERAFGEGLYIEKAPLSKSLSVAEIMAICSET